MHDQHRIRHYTARILHRRADSRVVQLQVRHPFARGELEFAHHKIALARRREIRRRQSSRQQHK